MKYLYIILATAMTAIVSTSIAQPALTIKSFQLDINKKTGTLRHRGIYTSSSTIKLRLDTQIDGFALTGKICQPQRNSFVRVLLEDDNGKEYVVLESNRLINDVDTVVLSDYCEETKLLSNIHPIAIHIYLDQASLALSHFSWNPSNKEEKGEYHLTKESWQKDFAQMRYEQVQRIVSNINENNKLHKRLWRADITSLSMTPWENKKRMLGMDGDCYPTCFEYYAFGIFEFGEPQKKSSPKTTSPFVDHFDWRNRHGINWMTPVKDQGTGAGCWAFAAIGLTEALVNLYYNQKLDYDLSEQEVISCSGYGDNTTGGSMGGALGWIADHGVSEETSFPFSDSDEPCENKGDYNEVVSFSGKYFVPNHTANENNNVKGALINNGPLVSGFTYFADSRHAHGMTLVGYATIHSGDTIRYFSNFYGNPNDFDIIQSGDSRIGDTYWIFKNSYGNGNYLDHEGYAYILFNDQTCFSTPQYAYTPVSTFTYSDADIAITDSDGDGYYYWGIGNKPSLCPSWIPDEPDGDDSDYTVGPMDTYGNLYDLSAHVNDVSTLLTNTNWVVKRFVYNNIVVPNGITLSINGDVVFYSGAKITIQGGTLIVNGGHLYNANIDIEDASNSVIRIINDGVIEYIQDESFEVPIGNDLNINCGAIKK